MSSLPSVGHQFIASVTNQNKKRAYTCTRATFGPQPRSAFRDVHERRARRSVGPDSPPSLSQNLSESCLALQRSPPSDRPCAATLGIHEIPVIVTDDACRVNSTLVLFVSLLGREVCHADVHARVFRDVLGISFAEPRIADDAILQPDYVDGVLALRPHTMVSFSGWKGSLYEDARMCSEVSRFSVSECWRMGTR
jgi:hypothetical protein